eukprot:TRINITY_DN64954_c0_g1_i1.p1 TRINITY_DN64954_c0_g1~~TRINITY_DN64954_c0_g1_i1.p1  ORF type:complete len:990 (-),score=149.13 TRINITY_DN64954_c0_g1_i1:933-3902(-)
MGKKGGGENIQVVVRCRPMNQKEKDKGCKGVVEVDVASNSITVNNAGSPITWTFDSVYNASFAQKDIYLQTVNPVVESVLAGYNATVFAYGQSGTGKTHTMTGVPGSEQAGVIPRTFEHIFGHIQHLQNEKKVYSVRCSMLELYNGKIRDLLGKNTKKSLDIKENAQHVFYVKDLESRQVTEGPQALEYMEEGIAKREVAATELNADSSRSHSVFTIEIMCVDSEQDPPATITSKLNLVDLAGSERQTKTGATGDTLKEGCNINLSLSALGTVIDCLVKASGHIPYRSSPLTMLLKDSLGGSAKTVMFATLGPTDMNVHETVSTLRFADRAKKIKNKPKVQMDPKDARIKELEDTIKALKAKLGITEDVENAEAEKASASDSAVVELRQQNEQMEEKIGQLQSELSTAQTNLERETEEAKSKTFELEKKLEEVEKDNQQKTEDLQAVKDEKELQKSNMDDLTLQLADLQRVVTDFIAHTAEKQKQWPLPESSGDGEESTDKILDDLNNAKDNESKFQHIKTGLGKISKNIDLFQPSEPPAQKVSLAESLKLSESLSASRGKPEELVLSSVDGPALDAKATEEAAQAPPAEVKVEHYIGGKDVAEDTKDLVKKALEAQRAEFEAEKKRILMSHQNALAASLTAPSPSALGNQPGAPAEPSPSSNVPITVTATDTATLAQMEQLQQQLQLKTVSHQKLTEDFNKLLNNYKLTEGLVQQARVELNSMQRAHEQIQAELVNKGQQLEKSREIINKHQDMLKKKDESILKFKDKVASVTKTLDLTKQEHKDALMDQSEKLIALQNRKLDDLQKRHEDELKTAAGEKSDLRKKNKKLRDKLHKSQTAFDELHCEYSKLMEEFEGNKMRQMKDHFNGKKDVIEEERKGIEMAIKTQNSRVDNLMGRMFGGDSGGMAEKRYAHPPQSAHGHSSSSGAAMEFNVRASKTAPLKGGMPGTTSTGTLLNHPPPAVPAFTAAKAPLPPMGPMGGSSRNFGN